MHQKRMAQVDGSRLPCRQHLTPLGAVRKAFGRQLSQREATFASRSEPSRDIEMRTNTNTCRRVILLHIGEKKQHQQGASFRRYVDAPIEVVAFIPILWRETGVDVPASVHPLFPRGKPNHEHAQTFSGPPSPRTD